MVTVWWRRALLLLAMTTALMQAVDATIQPNDDGDSTDLRRTTPLNSADNVLEELSRLVLDGGTPSSSPPSSTPHETTTTWPPRSIFSYAFGENGVLTKPATHKPKKSKSAAPTRRTAATPTPAAPLIPAESLSGMTESPTSVATGTVKPADGNAESGGALPGPSEQHIDPKTCPKYNEITSQCGGVCGNNMMCIRYRHDGECVETELTTCVHPENDPNGCAYECLDGTSSDFDQWFISPFGVPAWNTALHNNKQIEAMRVVSVPRNITQLSLQFVFNELNGATQKGKVATVEFPDKRIISADSTLSSIALVNLDYRKIPDLVFSSQLQYLVLNNCLLTELPAIVLRLSNLNFMDLTANYIQRLPVEIAKLPLAGLYVDDNEITALPAFVASMSSLRVLSFAANNISQVTMVARTSALTELILDYNRLSDFGGEIPSLLKLYLRGNRLTAFPSSLATLTNLERLDLTENALSSQAIDEIASGKVTHANLKELMLGSNGLHSVPDLGDVFPNLKTLWVRNNSIEKVEGAFSGKLETLHAFMNQITSFTAMFTRLTTLDLSGNKLETLAHVDKISPVLQSLNVSNNQLTTLGSSTTTSTTVMASLCVLNASNNSLSSFKLQLPMLRTLDLSGNKLTAIPDSVWTYNVLDALHLHGNPALTDLQVTRDQHQFLTRLSVFTVDASAMRSACPDTWTTTLRDVTLCVEGGVANTNSDTAATQSISKSTAHPWRWASLALGVIAVVAVVAFVVVLRRRRERERLRFKYQQHDYDPALKPEDRTAGLTASNLGGGSRVRSHPSNGTGLCVGIWDDEELQEKRVDFDSITLESKLAAGAYGEVWIGTYRLECVAVKKLSDAGMRDKTALAYFVSEIKLLAQLDHPRIIRFYGVAWTCVTDLCAVLEYMPGGDLHSMLRTGLLPTTRWTAAKLQIALDTVEALTYVHTLDDVLIHRDLKSRNVLLDDEWRAKVTDFGISRFQRESDATMTSGIGTGRWMAPEVIMGRVDYTEKVDIYSFGVILSELDTHEMPYTVPPPRGAPPLPFSEMGILQQVAAGELRPSFSRTCPPAILEIAQKCLAFAPHERPSSLEVAYMLRQLIPSFPRDDAPTMRPSSVFSRGTFTMRGSGMMGNPSFFRKSVATTTTTTTTSPVGPWRGGSEIHLRSSAVDGEFSL